MMNHLYSVPLIPQNLSKQETVVQIAEVLNHLVNITDDIFKKVNERLNTNTEDLTNLNERLNSISDKIRKLKGTKKATQVFSSSKYPAAEINKEYVTLFDQTDLPELKRHIVHNENTNAFYEPLDKLQVYHVKLSDFNREETKNGLGELPLNVRYVNDLLLYNSGKNLYRNFVISDTLQGPDILKEDEVVNVSDIGAAPLSISDRSTLTKSITENYFYNPTIGDVPALNVPLDLPDLPGIADDVRFDYDLGPAIAPSATNTPNFHDLPPLTEFSINSGNINIDSEALPSLTTKEPLEKLIIPVEQKPQKVKEIEAVEVKDSPKFIEKPRIRKEVAQVDLPVQTDARASLMEAIRKAGGSRNAKLKVTGDKDIKKIVNPPSGDLMADLHAKLSMRRKGISGAKKTQNDTVFDSSTAMSKISAMIPPPPERTDFTDSITEDEDWD